MKRLFQNKLLNAFIKILIFGGLLFVLYRQLFSNEKIDIAYAHFLLNFNGNYFLLSMVVLLMVMNWTIESVKWKLLIDKLHPISWLDAIEGILFGVTFSLFTPSRIGEFGGRVFALNTDRKEAIVSTILGSIAQIVVNLSFGALGLLVYSFLYEKMDTYLAACQLGITLASLLIGWLGEKAMTRQLLSLFDYIHITLPEQWIHIISITI